MARAPDPQPPSEGRPGPIASRALTALAVASSLTIAGWLIWSAQRNADSRRAVAVPTPTPAVAPTTTPVVARPSPPATPPSQSGDPWQMLSSSKSALPIHPPERAKQDEAFLPIEPVDMPKDDEEFLSTSKSAPPIYRDPPPKPKSVPVAPAPP
jgi:hypothetical protein